MNTKSGPIAGQNDFDLEAWVEQFLSYFQSVTRAALHTFLAYRNDLFQLVRFLSEREPDKNVSVANFNRTNLRAFFASLSRQGIKPSSVSRKMSAVRTFAKFLLQEQVLKTNPTLWLVAPKIPKRLPKFLTQQEMEKVLSLPDRKTIAGFRDFMILELFYATGLRRSEILNLRVNWFNFYDGTCRVLGKGNKVRIVPVGAKTLENLQQYRIQWEAHVGRRLQEEEHFFQKEDGQPLTERDAKSLVRKWVSKVATPDKAHPHALRHTFATHLLDQGAELVSIKEMLGHKNLKTTAIYSHVSAAHLKKIYKQAHPRAD